MTCKTVISAPRTSAMPAAASRASLLKSEKSTGTRIFVGANFFMVQPPSPWSRGGVPRQRLLALSRSRRAEQEHGNFGLPEHLLGHAAEHPPGGPPAAPRGPGGQIHPVAAGVGEDLLGRGAGAHGRLGRDFLPLPALADSLDVALRLHDGFQLG